MFLNISKYIVAVVVVVDLVKTNLLEAVVSVPALVVVVVARVAPDLSLVTFLKSNLLTKLTYSNRKQHGET